MKRVLVIAAHPDDEVLGCGATISKYSRQGAQFMVLFIAEGSSCRYADPACVDSIAAIAKVVGVDLLTGLVERGLQLEPPADGAQALERFTSMRPAQRTPPGGPLSEDERALYGAALGVLSARPLPHWSQRLALVADLSNAVRDEQQPDMRVAAQAALRSALHHALQWAVIDAAAGRNVELIEVRIRAIEELHRSDEARNLTAIRFVIKCLGVGHL